jgi:hypothetical protein
MTDDTGLTLTPEQALALAWRLVLRQVANFEECLWWENVPMLTEESFDRLVRAMGHVVYDIEEITDEEDRASDFDSAALLAAAQDKT